MTAEVPTAPTSVPNASDGTKIARDLGGYPRPTLTQWLALMGASALLLGWWGFLAFTVVTSANPIVVSRPQCLTAPWIVEGTLLDGGGKLVVTEVFWPLPGSNQPDWKNKELDLVLIASLPSNQEGRFLFPLRSADSQRFTIQPIPSDFAEGTPVYRATSATREQMRVLLQERHRLESRE